MIYIHLFVDIKLITIWSYISRYTCTSKFSWCTTPVPQLQGDYPVHTSTGALQDHLYPLLHLCHCCKIPPYQHPCCKYWHYLILCHTCITPALARSDRTVYHYYSVCTHYLARARSRCIVCVANATATPSSSTTSPASPCKITPYHMPPLPCLHLHCLARSPILYVLQILLLLLYCTHDSIGITQTTSSPHNVIVDLSPCVFRLSLLFLIISIDVYSNIQQQQDFSQAGTTSMHRSFQISSKLLPTGHFQAQSYLPFRVWAQWTYCYDRKLTPKVTLKHIDDKPATFK